MLVKKAGSVLLNIEKKQIGLVYREKLNDYSFPKGHLEKGESLSQCAIRETEEETLRKNHLLINKAVFVFKYSSFVDETSEVYMYICVDDGPTDKNIALNDRELLRWFNVNDVENILSYDNLKEFWNKIKDPIKEFLDNDGTVTPTILNKLGY